MFSIVAILYYLAVVVIGVAVLYFIIRFAVRDGIRDAEQRRQRSGLPPHLR